VSALLISFVLSENGNRLLVVRFRVAAGIPGLLSKAYATFEEARMRLHREIAGALLLIAFTHHAAAEDGRHDRRTTAGPTQTRAPVLTGKERLGPKWTDEQRIDNCNVPIDKRGAKPRPSACANNPSS
jgi:hypothetical protein